MVFAEGFPRNSKGWIQFLSDRQDWEIRKKLFPPEVGKHPAKANLSMLTAIIGFVSKEGDTILDPFAGTGSIFIAALQGRKIVAIEVSPGYVELLQRCREQILSVKPNADILVLEGDCRSYLPLPADHIIYSPPYADIMKKTVTPTTDKFSEDIYSQSIEEFHKYSAGEGNIGMLPEFFYFQALEKVLQLCYESLSANGTMTFITKDHIEEGKRVHITKRIVRMAERLGFVLVAAHKRDVSSEGSPYTRIYRSQGRLTVDDEDIVIYRKAGAL